MKIQHETAKVCNFPTQKIIQKHFWGFAAGFHRESSESSARQCHLVIFLFLTLSRFGLHKSLERGPQDIPQLGCIDMYCV